MIISLCDRFHKLPSEILAEPVELLRLVRLEAAMRKPTPVEGDAPERPMTLGEQRDARLRAEGLLPPLVDDAEIRINAS